MWRKEEKVTLRLIAAIVSMPHILTILWLCSATEIAAHTWLSRQQQWWETIVSAWAHHQFFYLKKEIGFLYGRWW